MTVGAEKYCPICGKEVNEETFKRFGEYCCSEEHAEEYVKEVRAQRGAGNASALVGGTVPRAEAAEPPRRRGGCC